MFLWLMLYCTWWVESYSLMIDCFLVLLYLFYGFFISLDKLCLLICFKFGVLLVHIKLTCEVLFVLLVHLLLDRVNLPGILSFLSIIVSFVPTLYRRQRSSIKITILWRLFWSLLRCLVIVLWSYACSLVSKWVVIWSKGDDPIKVRLYLRPVSVEAPWKTYIVWRWILIVFLCLIIPYLWLSLIYLLIIPIFGYISQKILGAVAYS